MKLRFKGGHTEKVLVKDPKNPKKSVEVEKEQLTQVFEETEHHWPKPGSVLVVPDNVGSWLLYKRGALLESIAEDPTDTPASPRRLVAVMPEDTKEQAKDTKEQAKA